MLLVCIEETDMMVFGSGIGGLCYGGLLTRNGNKVLLLESHTIAGGATHLFKIKDFHFDSVSSQFSRLTSKDMQANTLAQVEEASNCTFGIPS